MYEAFECYDAHLLQTIHDFEYFYVNISIGGNVGNAVLLNDFQREVSDRNFYVAVDVHRVINIEVLAIRSAVPRASPST